MANVHIREPAVLARLPRPLSSSGRTWTCVVQGLRNGVVRKRQEICSAVDGDSVSIFEIRKGRNLFSFSVPPDSMFQCAPTSLRIKSETGTSQRRTYCATKKRSNAVLQLFQGDDDGDALTPSSHSIDLAERQSPVCDVALLQELDAVAAFHQDGSYEVFSSNLGSRISTGKFESSIENPCFVRFTAVSAADAPSSILKSRPDIVAATSAQSTYVCGVLTSRSETGEGQQSTLYCVWRLSMIAAGTLDSTLVLSHRLSATGQTAIRDQDSATFVSRSSKLILRSSAKIAKYDLSLVVPRQILDFASPAPDHISNVEISDNLILCANAGAIQLYNSSFRSLQASVDLGKNSLKRKRGELFGPVSFLAYFPSLHRAVGIRRNHLVAIDLLSRTNTNLATEFQQSSLLLHNVGKGAAHPSRQKFSSQGRHISLGTPVTQLDITEEWKTSARDLETSASQNDGTTFETIFLRHVQETDGAASGRHKFITEHKINYVLTKIFAGEANTSSASSDKASLSIRLFCPKLLCWLFERGYVSPSRLAQAMPSSQNVSTDTAFTSTGIFNALIDSDSTLVILHQYIFLTPLFNAEDLCQILKFVVRTALTNASEADESSEASHFDQSEQHGTLIIRSKHRSHISPSRLDLLLSSTLAKLAKLRHQIVSRALRRSLDHNELVALIQFLRQKLFHGGYTRTFSSLAQSSSTLAKLEEVPQDDAAQKPAGLSLPAIIAILSSCVDAIGPLGLLNSEMENNITEKLIPELSTEIQRATDAIEEAVQLQSIVRETLRYTESMLGQHWSRNLPGSNEGQAQKPGTIRTLHSTAVVDKLTNTNSTLPINLKAEMRIDQHKVRKGNGKSTERSKREMGMLQDRLRGPYSLERLVL